MSWYVENLLINRNTIRNDVENLNTESENLVLSFNEDTYDDLLSVEMKIQELVKKKILSDKDLEIIELVASNKSIRQLGRESRYSRPTISKSFAEICEKIAFCLGEHFANYGYIVYLRDKYNFSSEEVQKIRNFIFKLEKP